LAPGHHEAMQSKIETKNGALKNIETSINWAPIYLVISPNKKMHVTVAYSYIVEELDNNLEINVHVLNSA
jgi:hypothetical protein